MDDVERRVPSAERRVHDAECRDLDGTLSEPTPECVEAMGRLEGDLLVLGAAGKMGPTLVRLAIRASAASGVARTVTAVARFSDPASRDRLLVAGARVQQADLADPEAVAALPDVPNVVFMVGQKFGTGDDPGRTWVINSVVPGLVARRFRQSRLVVFSTGNVYPLWPMASAGPTEADPPGPIGEYAQSALARERVVTFFTRELGGRAAILRINYAIEPRYGVLRDIAEQVLAGTPIDLSMGAVNVIWQRDANAIALQALEHCANPPLLLNVTGPAVRVRDLAAAFARRFGVTAAFARREAETALLSNPGRCERLFGRPPVPVEEMVERVARWIEAGGPSLGKPTHFGERGGRF